MTEGMSQVVVNVRTGLPMLECSHIAPDRITELQF
jgi:hypothetical protein